MEKQLFKDHLRSLGLRLTPERARVLSGVLAMPPHFEPEELVAVLRGGDAPVSRASVYRTLPLLIECGLIKEAIYRDRKSRYERAAGKGHHDHILCTGCGAIVEFVSAEIEALQLEICRSHGVTPTDHTLEIRGLCRKCG